MIVNSSLVGR